jgi:flagellar hook-basal body complex protein FliE
MELKLKPFDFTQAAARAGMQPNGQPLGGTAKVAEGGSFQTEMTRALKAVSAQQFETQRLQREVQLDNPTVSLEETMISMQKASVGFQAAMTVRGRLVQAYSEIMNMAV